MEKDFSKLFSNQSTDYAKFRPRYPDSLFSKLAEQTAAHDAAWDCATGNGQAAVQLAKFYREVMATDSGEKQLASAEKNPKVTYQKAPAEDSGLPAQHFDLITVAQAFHWFRAAEFAREAKRVLKPHGLLAIWCYGLAEITPAVDTVVESFCFDKLGKDWEKERQLVDENYAHVKLPLKTKSNFAVVNSSEWSFEHLVGYLGTWSAVQNHLKRTQINPMEDLLPKLQSAWGTATSRTAQWPITVRLWENE